ncbi:NucA/NucB deoxyribonuclease domain-containing protein, partial [Streptomyces youssoufiensis]
LASRLPITPSPSAMAPAAIGSSLKAGATYPEPPRSMTQAECQAGLQGGFLFYIKSRFSMCSGLQTVQTWKKNGKLVGESTFTLWVMFSVPDPKDRTVKFDYHFTNFKTTGETGASAMKGKTEVDSPHWPSSARKRQSGQIPPTSTFAALRAKPKCTHKVIFDGGQGRGTDDIVAMAYAPYLSTTAPPNWTGEGFVRARVGFLAAQWDSASYLGNRTGDVKKRGGAAFPVSVYLPYSSKSTAAEKAVTAHIKKARTKPGDTKPVNKKKSVPGFDAKHKLHRLYHDVTRRKENRSEAVKACVKYWGKGYSQGKKLECDEYPFAVTYEGCAQPQYETKAAKDNYSAMPLPKNDNSAAGSIIGQFLTKNRIVDGRHKNGEEIDAFLVKLS